MVPRESTNNGCDLSPAGPVQDLGPGLVLGGTFRIAGDTAWFVATPAFMPVGTQATVKGLTPDQIHADRHAHAAGKHVSSGASAG